MIEITEKYNLTFKNRQTSGRLNYKACNAPDETMYATIAGHLNTSLYTQPYLDMLKEIDKALAHQAYAEEIGIEDSFVDITPTVVIIEDFVAIPTSDYKKILVAWIEFMRTPPLNGAKV